MSVNIIKSTLFQHELWTIEESRKLKNRAYPGYIADKDAFLQLIIHAWQWDKNAMVQYALVLAEAKDQPADRDAEGKINNFLFEYKNRITDSHGKTLVVPELLHYPPDFIIKTLADAGYPLASNYMRGKLLPEIDRSSLEFLPLSQEKRNQSIFYTRNAIKGGYKLGLLLNDYILFPAGVRYCDMNYSKIVKMSDRLNSLPSDSWGTIINEFECHAWQGASYAMVRMCEAYLYGTGVKPFDEMAYAWCKLADKSFAKYQQGEQHDWRAEQKERTINNYNKSLSQIIRKRIGLESKTADFLYEQLNAKVLDWDYQKWVSILTRVQPLP